jgi:hypothetical protein
MKAWAIVAWFQRVVLETLIEWSNTWYFTAFKGTMGLSFPKRGWNVVWVIASPGLPGIGENVTLTQLSLPHDITDLFRH